MILYHVRSEDGEFIMNAPLDVVSRIFEFSAPTTERVERETKELTETCIVGDLRKHGGAGYYWRTIQIQRLPIEIPRQAG